MVSEENVDGAEWRQMIVIEHNSLDELINCDTCKNFRHANIQMKKMNINEVKAEKLDKIW